MRDALKSYLALAGGLVEVPRQRALAAAKALVAQGEATAEQVTALADDLITQSRANREAVAALVKFEVDRTLGRVGLATGEEVGDLAARLQAVEAEVRALKSALQAGSGAGPTTSSTGLASAADVKRAQQAAARKTAPATKARTTPSTAPALKSAAQVKATAQEAARTSPTQQPSSKRASSATKAPALHTAAEAKATGHPDVPGSAGRES